MHTLEERIWVYSWDFDQIDFAREFFNWLSFTPLWSPFRSLSSHSRTSLILPARAGPSAGGVPPLPRPSHLPLAVLAAVARPCYCRGRAAPLQLGKEARVASGLGPASH